MNTYFYTYQRSDEQKVLICKDFIDIAKAWYDYGLKDASMDLLTDKYYKFYNTKEDDMIVAFHKAMVEMEDLPIAFYIMLLTLSNNNSFCGQSRIDLVNKATEVITKEKGEDKVEELLKGLY
jgi:hypothetical protein